jgi:hypothetical protein
MMTAERAPVRIVQRNSMGAGHAPSGFQINRDLCAALEFSAGDQKVRPSRQKRLNMIYFPCMAKNWTHLFEKYRGKWLDLFAGYAL